MPPRKKPAGSEEESFADMLKRCRAERGLSQVDLWKLSGVHHVTIARIELGQKPQGSTKRKLLDALEKAPKLPKL